MPIWFTVWSFDKEDKLIGKASGSGEGQIPASYIVHVMEQANAFQEEVRSTVIVWHEFRDSFAPDFTPQVKGASPERSVP